MNGTESRIEIFNPFGVAFERMKAILFQPFDFAKWCVLGFAAFLSGAWGSPLSFRFPLNGNWNFRSTSHHTIPTSDSMPLWLIPVMVGVAVFVLIWIIVLMWVVSRGRFIFTDCVVKNRAAIVAPWTEYRREGNSFFLFSLVVMFLAILLFAGVALLIFVPLGLFENGKGTAALNAIGVFALVLVGFVWAAFAIFFALVSQFMVPVMYRRRCLAREAFFDVSKLVLTRPGPFILLALFGIVLFMAFLILCTIVTCLTCCMAGLPYVSSVVFLPALVWLLMFKLLFLRQFGSEYDVWAAMDLPQAPVAPTEPPVQPPPPSAPPSLPAT